MRALILLKVNPGRHSDVDACLQSASFTGVSIIDKAHVMGQYDGIIRCDAPDLQSLNSFAEVLRKDGVFYTETLVSIE